MRLIGVAERGLEAMCRRVMLACRVRRTLAEQGTIRADIAESRMEIEQARLLTLKAACMMDTDGNKAARAEIAMIKVVVPNVALRVIDRAIQAHGGGRRERGFPAGRRVGERAHHAARRRPRRSAPRVDREAGTQKVRIMRPVIIALVAILGAATVTNNPQAVAGPGQAGREPSPKFTVREASIADMRAALEAGRVTSAEIVQQCNSASRPTRTCCTRRSR